MQRTERSGSPRVLPLWGGGTWGWPGSSAGLKLRGPMICCLNLVEVGPRGRMNMRPPENRREGTRAAAQRCGWRGGRPATLGVRRHRSHVESNRSSLPVLQLPSTARESQYEARPGRTAAH